MNVLNIFRLKFSLTLILGTGGRFGLPLISELHLTWKQPKLTSPGNRNPLTRLKCSRWIVTHRMSQETLMSQNSIWDAGQALLTKFIQKTVVISINSLHSTLDVLIVKIFRIPSNPKFFFCHPLMTLISDSYSRDVSTTKHVSWLSQVMYPYEISLNAFDSVNALISQAILICTTTFLFGIDLEIRR